MAFSGVRTSWDTLARNCDLATEACSSAMAPARRLILVHERRRRFLNAPPELSEAALSCS
jgi:hypothetical protein